jgi:hypothetical protein
MKVGFKMFRYNVVLSNCSVGEFCIIHNGSSIGQDGEHIYSFTVYKSSLIPCFEKKKIQGCWYLVVCAEISLFDVQVILQKVGQFLFF